MRKSMFETARIVAMSSEYKFRHGAILVRGPSIIKISANKSRAVNIFNDYHKNNRASLHAEIGCILNLRKEVTRGCDIYVCRILANNLFACSDPCEMCQTICAEMGIRKIFYTVEENVFDWIRL